MINDPDVCARLRRARLANRDAILALKDAKAVVRQTEQTIEDILVEIDTDKAILDGRSAPLLDAIDRKQAERSALEGN